VNHLFCLAQSIETCGILAGYRVNRLFEDKSEDFFLF